MTIKATAQEKRIRNHRKIRSKVNGTSDRPRLAIFKSNTNIYAQVINDESGTTLVQANSKEIKKGSVSEKALEVGRTIAERALAKNIKKVVFDRGGYKYVGKVRAIAEGAREGGLNF
jgi:large subunit ribosomal protein L18